MQSTHASLQPLGEEPALGGIELGQHLLFHLLDGCVARCEHAAAFVREARRVDATMVRVGVSANQSLVLERVQDLDHRLGRPVRPTRELRVGEWLPSRSEDAERRVLKRRQSLRLEALVDLSANGALESRDDVAHPWFDGRACVLEAVGHCRGIVAHASLELGFVRTALPILNSMSIR